MNIFHVIGVMSGTSLDGVDIVYVKFNKDETWSFDIIYAQTYKYEDSITRLMADLSTKSLEVIKKIDIEYSYELAKIINQFISQFSIKKIDFISSHGHTAIHNPSNSITYQIGNLPILSKIINDL